jgi:hypothetical protein
MDNKRKATATVYNGPGTGTPKTKRFKNENEEDDFKTGFETELAAFELENDEHTENHDEIGKLVK